MPQTETLSHRFTTFPTASELKRYDLAGFFDNDAYSIDKRRHATAIVSRERFHVYLNDYLAISPKANSVTHDTAGAH